MLCILRQVVEKHHEPLEVPLFPVALTELKSPIVAVLVVVPSSLCFPRAFSVSFNIYVAKQTLAFTVSVDGQRFPDGEFLMLRCRYRSSTRLFQDKLFLTAMKTHAKL